MLVTSVTFAHSDVAVAMVKYCYKISLYSESANILAVCIYLCIHSSSVIVAEEVAAQLSLKIVKRCNTSQSYIKYSIYTPMLSITIPHIFVYRHS